MAEASCSCIFCDFLREQNFDFRKIAVDVIPDAEANTIDASNEIKKIKKKLAKKRMNNRDKKLQKIMKELITLLGHGQQARSLPEAVAKLLERNYPDLVDWDGKNKLVIFVPDYYLNKAVCYVDPKRAEVLLKNLEAVVESMPERKAEFEKHTNVVSGAQRTYWGEVPEVNLYNALKRRYAETEESIAVFQGLNIHKFNIETQEGELHT